MSTLSHVTLTPQQKSIVINIDAMGIVSDHWDGEEDQTPQIQEVSEDQRLCGKFARSLDGLLQLHCERRSSKPNVCEECDDGDEAGFAPEVGARHHVVEERAQKSRPPVAPNNHVGLLVWVPDTEGYA